MNRRVVTAPIEMTKRQGYLIYYFVYVQGIHASSYYLFTEGWDDDKTPKIVPQ